MSTDHNREAFRLLRNAPALVGMELLWRWSFGLGLIALVAIAYARIRPVILLAGGEALNLQDPVAFAESATNMIMPVLPLLAKTSAQVFCVAAVLWAAISALGRGIITRTIVGRLAKEHGVVIAPDAPRWASFAVLQCARVLMLLILVIGYLGGAYFGAFLRLRWLCSLHSSPRVCSGATSTGCSRLRPSLWPVTRSRRSTPRWKQLLLSAVAVRDSEP